MNGNLMNIHAWLRERVSRNEVIQLSSWQLVGALNWWTIFHAFSITTVNIKLFRNF